MRRCARSSASTPRPGILTAEAGVLLSDIIAYAAPHGYFPPVVPGTQFVTLGGAIANDVHGKNHHRRGTFGCHVEELSLLRSDGKTYICSPARECAPVLGDDRRHGADRHHPVGVAAPDAGGLARHRRDGHAASRRIDDYLDRAEAADAANEYAVAWIDQLAGGKGAGRGPAADRQPRGAWRANAPRPPGPASRCRSSRRSTCSTGRS